MNIKLGCGIALLFSPVAAFMGIILFGGMIVHEAVLNGFSQRTTLWQWMLQTRVIFIYILTALLLFGLGIFLIIRGRNSKSV